MKKIIFLVLFLLSCSRYHNKHQKLEKKQPLAINSVESCWSCHSSVRKDNVPWIAGQNQEYLAKQLLAFKFKNRIDPTKKMNQIAAELTDSDILRISKYFSEERFEDKISQKQGPEFLRGQQIAYFFCMSCHENKEYQYKSTFNLVPIITGQSKTYLKNQLEGFRNGNRSNSLMEEYIKILSDSDKEAVSLFFSK